MLPEMLTEKPTLVTTAAAALKGRSHVAGRVVVFRGYERGRLICAQRRSVQEGVFQAKEREETGRL